MWQRPYFMPGGENPFLLFVAFCDFAQAPKISRSEHRVSGIPEGIDIVHLDQATKIDSFRAGIDLPGCECEEALRKKLDGSTHAFVLRGAMEDQEDLGYLRDVVGLLTALIDAGAVAIYDPQRLKVWSAQAWRRDIFAPDSAVPFKHTVLLVNQEASGRSHLHTRGLRKFGRPDLSVREVPEEAMQMAIELVNRFIEYQAHGGVIVELQGIVMEGLPEGMRCRHGGDVDDPDFNNTHVELVWPSDESEHEEDDSVFERAD